MTTSPKPQHLADAVASLDVELTIDEIERLETPYTPRDDFQGISDPATLAAISQRVGIAPADAATKAAQASGRKRPAPTTLHRPAVTAK